MYTELFQKMMLINALDRRTKALSYSECLADTLEWDKWLEKIPYLRFDPNWEVKIIPPYNGAMIRFHVRCNTEGDISVYLDCCSVLGSFFGESDMLNDEPYWEIYPYNTDDDIHRVHIDDIDGLMSGIGYALDQMRESENCKKI